MVCDLKSYALVLVLSAVPASLIAQEKAQPTTGTQTPSESKGQAGASSTPAPENPIPGLIRSANLAATNRDYSTCAQLLEKVVAIDPTYKNALNYLGWTYNALGQYSKAEPVLRKAIALDPKDPLAYNNLGQALAGQKKYDEAIAEYLKQIELNPKDRWAFANVGRVYLLTKQYEKAVSALQRAAENSPQDASVQFNLGRAYAKTGEAQKATEALEKSAQLQPIPTRLNSVAYQMADEKLDLPKAEELARSAIAATAAQMRETSLDHLTREDSYFASRMASYWDTWGWIRFQEGNLREAETYVRSAWMIHSLGINADHLGQIYEKEARKAEAIRMYQMALAADASVPEAKEHLTRLADPNANTDSLAEEGRKLLKEARTVPVKNSRQAEGFAEFWILLSPGPAVRGVKFITGDDELTSYAKDLENISYPNTFPEATELRLLRRGRLACIRSSAECRLELVSSQAVPTDEMATTAPSVAGDITRVTVGRDVQAGRIRSKVQPLYPEGARLARVSGVVRLRAVIGVDGNVMQLEVISGHPMLVQAALDAVRQWVYEPTTYQGKPVEVDTVIDVMFYLRQ